MMNSNPLMRLAAAVGVTMLIAAATVHAAVVPDRTRVIYDGDAQWQSVTVANKSEKYPYVVQSWIEDEHGKKITSPFMVLPPLQRIEPTERNVLRIVRLPGDALPTDRESVFYLNIREIPPKTDAVNALQIALHSKLKLFYRPKGLQPAADEDPTLPMTVRLDPSTHRLVLDNPTPYHVTVVKLFAGESKTPLKFGGLMVAPMSAATTDVAGPLPTTLSVVHINDSGGETAVRYACDASACRSQPK
ncbi:TPA: molecular chaperone [Burkholderia vietnamiensis]|uniref:Molecular chaperone n=1 Tax=Burkholderia vietnamiensis TaxID=60552 RepID=A0AA44Y318_BURVI|nr:fimbrial protein [Burkholderia vietnamiensis]KVS24372.1 fimbrial protein [Burkholderia vietnamiensis]MBR8011236.1 molecular chaperone [Burkholderia vietnamiensis]MBR8202680.1 molecular chaperone [Burkholderia vietnamiensis]PRH43308.1 molecular chaperone [Burkholderia vietnamiensis]